MIRFWACVGPLRYGSWARLSYQYLLEMPDPVRALSTTGGACFNGGDAWQRVAERFNTPLPDQFSANIVCAPLDFLGRLWTIGMQNIAIVGGPTNPDAIPKVREILNKYDQIWTPYDWGLPEYYGINTKYVPPFDLKPFIS